MKTLVNKNLIKGIQHIGIPTNDIEVTEQFYVSLGFVLVMETFNEAAGEKVAFLQLGNLMIETYENRKAVLADGAIDHISLDVKSVDTLYDEMKKQGYTMMTDGVQCLPFWEYGIRFFIISGPNKERLEFCERLSAKP